MARPCFSVPIAQLERHDHDQSWDIPVDWLRNALLGTEASAGKNPGSVSAHLSRSGRRILVRGRITTSVVMPCSRSLDPVDIDIDVPFDLLLTPKDPGAPSPDKPERPLAKSARAPAVASSSRSQQVRARANRSRLNKVEAGGPEQGRTAPSIGKASAATAGQRSAARKPRASLLKPAAEHLSDDAEMDAYDGEWVVLDSFVREHILLELPMFPVRSDLRSETALANGAASSNGAPGPSSTPEVDPRLMPLALLAEQMRKKLKE